jgi:3-methylcrotonyl-CoA carboxylase beta subunit
MDINFNKNEDHNRLLLTDLKQRFAKVRVGGGEKRIEKLHSEDLILRGECPVDIRKYT